VTAVTSKARGRDYFELSLIAPALEVVERETIRQCKSNSHAKGNDMTDFLFQPPTVNVRERFLSARSHGRRVMEPNPGGYPPPDHVFLIYMSQNAAHRPIARHMYAPKGTDLDTTVNMLFDLAEADDTTSPYRVGNSYLNLIWKEPCYLYLVLDVADTKFIDDEFPEHDPIQFHDKKPIRGSDPRVYRHFDENHAFFDGVIGEVRGRSAFRCVNYLTDESGNPLRYPKKRFYGFEIRFLVTYDDGTELPHDVDPDGENQGPPSLVLELPIRQVVTASDQET
jgi:hypothetical protein